MKVATEYPKMPTKTVGTRRDLHPLAFAIPAPVVGPPTFAFDASNNDFLSNLRSFPTPRMIAKCTAI